MLFPHVWQQLTNNMEEDHQQAITGIQREHQLAIADRNNQLRTTQHENVGLQGEIRAKGQHIATLLARNQGSTLFAEGDTPNAIIT